MKLVCFHKQVKYNYIERENSIIIIESNHYDNVRFLSSSYGDYINVYINITKQAMISRIQIRLILEAWKM